MSHFIFPDIIDKTAKEISSAKQMLTTIARNDSIKDD